MRSILLLSLLIFAVSAETRNVKVRGRVTCVEKENGLIYIRKIKDVKIDLREQDSLLKHNDITHGFTDDKGLFYVEGGYNEMVDKHRFFLEIRFPCAEAGKCSNEAYRKACMAQNGNGYYEAASIKRDEKSIVTIPYRFATLTYVKTKMTYPVDYQLKEDGATYSPNRPEL